VPAALVVGAGLAGAAVGPWVNLAADRIPARRSVLRSGPSCPACGRASGLAANLAARSWGLVRPCPSCRARSSIRGLVVETATTAIFASVALRFGLSWTVPATLVFMAGLVALATCDVEHHLLPRRIVYPTAGASAALLVVAATATGEWRRLGIAAACAAVGFGALLAIHAVNPKWLGFGDVRLAGLIGLVVGWVSPLSLWVALVAADVAGLAVMGALVALGRARRDTAFPFGVFLAAGAIVAVLA
jgi:leader peptidase (prepilin peptidase)/N-methyltransferase